jgi:hypothetical protein
LLSRRRAAQDTVKFRSAVWRQNEIGEHTAYLRRI